MKSRVWVTIPVAAIAAGLVWAVSPWISGYREPWDAGGYFYILALLLAGAIAGLISPRPLWAHYVGAVIGQLCYELIFLRVGALVILGAAFLLGYSVVFLLGAYAGGQLRHYAKA